MKSKAIYYETRCGLIPCKFLGWAKSPAHETTGNYNAVIKLSQDGEGIAYKKGDSVECWELYRKKPVKHGLVGTVAYWDKTTFKRVYSAKA